MRDDKSDATTKKSEGYENATVCWHEGKEIVYNDKNLVKHPDNIPSGEHGNNENNPNYPLLESKSTGRHGSNPWR